MKIAVLNGAVEMFYFMLVSLVPIKNNADMQSSQDTKKRNHEHVNIALHQVSSQIQILHELPELLETPYMICEESIIMIGHELQIFDDDEEQVEIGAHLVAD
jgi:hypothetical protein